ncbi:DUF6204 family protein [Streptomyces sp. CB02923]|uniref:DUF6204 family protein n=1 Tax=Streptomyces sp. CB02923 TaxID=1718985 RepID=UPI0009A0DCDC|nr:DUF6204 family protein [Streptomyces sp. CB02923]
MGGALAFPPVAPVVAGRRHHAAFQGTEPPQQPLFTQGALAYDAALRSFTYRYVIVSDAADGEEMAAALAEEKAEAALTAAGYGYRELRSSATDMDTMKVNRKGR